MDCKSEDEFHSVLNEVNKRWPTLHNNAKHFLSYFVKGSAGVIKDSMRADIRSMCGLGFPPATYSQNASECLNRYIKENAKGSEDVTGSLVEFVENISSVVKRQLEEQFLAVIGKGTYRLTKQFHFLRENENAYYRMSQAQKDRVRNRFFTTSVSDALEPRTEITTNVSRKSSFSIEARETGINCYLQEFCIFTLYFLYHMPTHFRFQSRSANLFFSYLFSKIIPLSILNMM